MNTGSVFLAHAQVTPSGQPWVEVQVTGDAADRIAWAVAHRVANHRPVMHTDLVALIREQIAGTSIELTPEQVDETCCDLMDAATVAEETAREGAYWQEVTP